MKKRYVLYGWSPLYNRKNEYVELFFQSNCLETCKSAIFDRLPSRHTNTDRSKIGGFEKYKIFDREKKIFVE